MTGTKTVCFRQKLKQKNDHRHYNASGKTFDAESQKIGDSISWGKICKVRMVLTWEKLNFQCFFVGLQNK